MDSTEATNFHPLCVVFFLIMGVTPTAPCFSSGIGASGGEILDPNGLVGPSDRADFLDVRIGRFWKLPEVGVGRCLVDEMGILGLDPERVPISLLWTIASRDSPYTLGIL